MNTMASYAKGGPLWAQGSTSLTWTSATAQPARRQSWATATWATGQSIISGMLYNKKDFDIGQHHRGEYQSFRDEILMPPAYESIVPVPRNPPSSQPQSQTPSQLQSQPQPQLQSPSHLAQPSPPPPGSTAPAAPARHQALELPSLPRLLGVENLDEWDDILMRTLRLHRLAEYITAPYPGVPEPPSNSANTPWSSNKRYSNKNITLTREHWEANRAAVCLLMVGSFSADVRDTLLAYGYDPAEENPKLVHDLVLEALPKAAGEDVSTWMRELSSISPAERRFDGSVDGGSSSGSGSGSGSLREYALRLQYLRRRLYQAEPQPNDNLVLVMAVLGLARCERYEGLSMTLGRELERGGLSWARFMGDLSAVYGREVRDKKGKRWKAVDDRR